MSITVTSEEHRSSRTTTINGRVHHHEDVVKIYTIEPVGYVSKRAGIQSSNIPLIILAWVAWIVLIVCLWV